MEVMLQNLRIHIKKMVITHLKKMLKAKRTQKPRRQRVKLKEK